MAEEITNATEMAGLNKKEVFWCKFKVLEAKIPHEMVRKKRGGDRAVTSFKQAISN